MLTWLKTPRSAKPSRAINGSKAPAPEFRRMSSGSSNSQKQVEQFWTQPVDGSTHERDDASRCLDELRLGLDWLISCFVADFLIQVHIFFAAFGNR